MGLPRSRSWLCCLPLRERGCGFEIVASAGSHHGVARHQGRYRTKRRGYLRGPQTRRDSRPYSCFRASYQGKRSFILVRMSKSSDPNNILSTRTFVCLLKTCCAHQEPVLLLLTIHLRYPVILLTFTSYGNTSDTCLRSHACRCNGCWPSTGCL
jgi:hypothetical protein